MQPVSFETESIGSINFTSSLPMHYEFADQPALPEGFVRESLPWKYGLNPTTQLPLAKRREAVMISSVIGLNRIEGHIHPMGGSMKAPSAFNYMETAEFAGHLQTMVLIFRAKCMLYRPFLPSLPRHCWMV